MRTPVIRVHLKIGGEKTEAGGGLFCPFTPGVEKDDRQER
jgi:hypothetical protein